MTPKEAIETLKIATAEVEWNYPMDYAVAFESAIESLEKQIPKKPVWDMGWVCPNCKHAEILNFSKRPEWDDLFCKKCGQALDWGDCE